MDHSVYPWSPISIRRKLGWPHGASLALSVLILLEHVEVDPPPGSVQTPIPAGAGPFPKPDLPLLAHCEYGYRVGFYRILETLDRVGVPPAVAMDAMLAERLPYLARYCADRTIEVVAHGISASRVVTSAMAELEERAYITDAFDRLEASTGVRPRGWMGPSQSESLRTATLLDELGAGYVCDWPNDEQPYYLETPNRLVSLPTQLSLDDGYLIWERSASPDEYGAAVARAIERLTTDGTSGGRSLVLVVRPWLVGQPFRIGAFEKALRDVDGASVWFATPGEIVEAFRSSSGSVSRDDPPVSRGESE
jgi:hypothetical protein